MPNRKKKGVTAASELTQGEEDLVTHLERGYQLETDSLGGNPVLRRLKDNDVIRPADTNASTVKALKEKGMIRPEKGGAPLTTVWGLNKRGK